MEITSKAKNTELQFSKASRKRRIIAFLIDHFILTFLILGIIFTILGPNFADESNPSKMMSTLLIVMPLGFFIYLSKDAIKGISIGKWIMGIMVRNETNYELVPPFGALLKRNLLIVILPVEFIMLLLSVEKRRIGDTIAKTVVLQNPFKSPRMPRVITAIVLGFGILIFVFLFSMNALKNSKAYQVSIEEIESNDNVLNETGEIIGYGSFPSGSIKMYENKGEANLLIKVKGKKKDIEVQTYLEKQADGKWKLLTISKK